MEIQKCKAKFDVRAYIRFNVYGNTVLINAGLHAIPAFVLRTSKTCCLLPVSKAPACSKKGSFESRICSRGMLALLLLAVGSFGAPTTSGGIAACTFKA